MLAQLVPQRELGKVYGLLAILDAALPFLGKSVSMSHFHNLLALPLANPLWDATIDTMPGAFCLVNAGVRDVQNKDFMNFMFRLWASLASSILLCGPSSVSTICSQPPPPSLIIGMFCLLCVARRKKLLLSCGEALSYESPFFFFVKNITFFILGCLKIWFLVFLVLGIESKHTLKRKSHHWILRVNQGNIHVVCSQADRILASRIKATYLLFTGSKQKLLTCWSQICTYLLVIDMYLLAGHRVKAKATYLLVTGSKHSTERRNEEPS